MVTTILKSTRSALLAVDYSEKKVFEGTAGVVCVRNMANSNLDTVYGTFEDYESNPAISERTRRFCFHMAVSPSETDDLRDDEEKVVEYIDEMMQRLGYGQQPYIVYRHNDIEREHFHVVSSRIAPDGRPVMRANRYVADFEGKQVLKIMKTLSTKYGYTVGREQERLLSKEMTEAEWERVLATDRNKIEKMKQAFELSLKYNYTSFAQYRTVMANMGVFVKSQKKRGGDSLWFAIEDENGKIASKGFNAEYMLRTNVFDRYEATLKRNTGEKSGGVDRREVAKMQAVLEYSAGKAHTRSDFRKMCSECGIDFIPQEKGGHLLTYTLIDKAHTTVLTPMWLGRNVSAAALDELPLPEGTKVDELLLRQEDFDAIRRRVAELLGMAAAKQRKKEEEKGQHVGGGSSRKG